VTKEKIFPIKSGALVLINAGTYHYTMPDDPDVYNRSKLILSSAQYTKVAGLLCNTFGYADIFDRAVVYSEVAPDNRDDVERIFAEAAACQNNGGDEALLLACVLKLVYYLRKYAVEGNAVPIGFMSKAIGYINENIAAELDIDGICSAVNVSKYYFCRQFKRHTGLTVMQYILKTRIILAKDDLEKTSSSITDISERYGFSSASYFCRVFKEETGQTPRQYRIHARTANHYNSCNYPEIAVEKFY